MIYWKIYANALSHWSGNKRDLCVIQIIISWKLLILTLRWLLLLSMMYTNSLHLGSFCCCSCLRRIFASAQVMLCCFHTQCHCFVLSILNRFSCLRIYPMSTAAKPFISPQILQYHLLATWVNRYKRAIKEAAFIKTNDKIFNLNHNFAC